MLSVIQAIGTQVAAVTREGMQTAIRTRYGMWAASLTLFCLMAVNVLTFSADLEAGGAAIGLLTHTRYEYWTIPLAIGIGVALTLGTFAKIQRVLLIVPLAFLTYLATVFVVHPDWHAVATGFIPHLEGNGTFISAVIAVLGTTLTAYSYFWQTVEIATDPPPSHAVTAVEVSSIPGTILTGFVLLAIVVATGATLGVHHQNVNTPQDAARALAPIAGNFAELIFAIGLLGSALLALPVLVAGSAIATVTTFRWGGSLDKRPPQARRFYAVLYGALALSTALTFMGVHPIQLLFLSSIAGGIATPVTLGFLVTLGRDKKVMKDKPLPAALAAAGYAVIGIAVASIVALIRWH